MRAVVQRVKEARVVVEGQPVGQIGQGLLVLLGVGRGDSQEDAAYLARKIAGLRVFPDLEGKMNRALLEVGGEVLVVSQFTLYGDTRRGNRPSFTQAASPEEGRRLYERFCDLLAAQGLHVETGVFQAHMEVHLVNNGPVTLILDSSERHSPRRQHD
ncbi:MAG: D-aminoacyl-tRNA deacylase [Meiothermus sp.]|uniref:D-aminoacyl-tRNA deacylase n=1 Tax=Meiothermus sp. TaxID=1955249 RepID=UPI0025EC8918|nr:D-aminoacyl-tRNA deacylase [Meiothermus sp.]MCS7058975.1 D-aminoacyl-tRNA deacylase [Meiothermus sp.]MCS7195595.1 D-aminoacyl-tRNA deacylase [Meiothermus sp.]MCX7741403.1 D-aminoacyl-tRNA deacylase [Meiothermus sp.]MDW8091469.1 D-aminoacyl-tRNA deacylase [Meiothermus sp.]MDW8480330.1 D-aminoacyl-tRNA deacylase [Meiothermus sp.]